ncbi:MAG: prepilin peptidase [Bacillus sp. (in: firmicutes)]
MYILICLFVLGIILGSFYNVVGLRVPSGKSIVRPRSACLHCGHVLSASELIPVLSYVIQKGECKGCRTRISPIYMVVELVTGVIFALSPLWVGWGTELLLCYALVSLLVIITVSDLVYMLIPDKVLLFFMIVLLLLLPVVERMTIMDSFMGALTGFFLLWVIAVLSKGGMGGGDIKLFAVLGFALGVHDVLLALFFSVFYGALLGILFILFGLVDRRQPIPFGPFIALGALTVFYFGEPFVKWYFGVIS